MAQPSDHSPFLTQWSLVRSAIEHENTLKSHRVTWLLATQLFLFGGFMSIFVEALKNSLFMSILIYAPLALICLIGLFICILAWAAIHAAQKMIARLQNWWLIHCCDAKNNTKEWIQLAKYGEGQACYPPVNGMFTSNLHHVFDEAMLPISLGLSWVALLFFATAIFLRERFGTLPWKSMIIFIVLVVTMIVLAKWTVVPWLGKSSKRNIKDLARVAGKKNSKYSLDNLGSLEAEITNALDGHIGNLPGKTI